MITLNFEGPYHFSKIGNCNQINSPGIYIWGFTAKRNGQEYDIEDLKNEALVNLPNGGINEKNDQLFIPYYVGIASGNSNVFISKRLNNHYNISNSNGTKYTRLTKGYLKNITSGTPLDKYIKSNMSLLNKSDISYFNNPDFLRSLYSKNPFLYKKNYPIDKQILNGLNIDDSLDIFINRNNNNNFSFLYCPINEIKLKVLFVNSKFKIKLSYLESFVFYSLNGITISNCHVFNTFKRDILPDLLVNKVKLTVSNKCNNIFKTIPCNHFPGNY